MTAGIVLAVSASVRMNPYFNSDAEHAATLSLLRCSVKNRVVSILLIPRRTLSRCNTLIECANQSHTDLCQWGAPWRRRLHVLVWHIEIPDLLQTCKGKNGLCSRTGCKHVPVWGRVDNTKVSVASQAATLPTALSNHVAWHLITAVENIILRRQLVVLQSPSV